MTKRTPVSAQKNIWFDAQQVDDTDLTLEQNFNDTIESSTINNHIGTGVLPEVLVQNILFDSTLVSGFLDGTAIFAQNQPADNNLGNQLEITLSHSRVGGRKAVKVGVVGLDFQSNLQYETFYFKANETQTSRKHFTRILVLLFNDFIGDPALSFNLGGQILIKEVRPLSLSRAPLMVAQDVQPNLFFRDFFLDGPISLQALLQGALPLFNIDTLNIFTSESDQKVLSNGDVTTQIGEKFLASTNNIQKVTLLLSVRNLDIGAQNDLVWNGDLVVSIYPLQTVLDCPTDVAPNLPIDFSPSNIPVAQISVNFASLQAEGVVLDSVPQPVDFVLSNSPVAAGNVLTPGAFYAVAIKRSGSANKCDILISAGATANTGLTNSRITTFTGTLWVDIPEEQLWFRVWTDAAKISDGQAYESGHGIIIPKTAQDPTTLATVDFSQEPLQFTGNDVFRAVVAATTLENTPVPDQRTGNPVLTRQQFVPTVSLLNTIDITNLEAASEPLLIGAITDRNVKFFDSISSIINSKLYSATIVKDELIIRIIDDPTDITRFDSSVVALQTNLLNGDFVGAKITPNGGNPGLTYRIADSRLCSYIVGDVDGNGVVDVNDLNLLNSYLGYDLTVGLPLHTKLITDGYTTSFTNGYLTEIVPFSNLFGVQFQLVNPSTGAVVADGYDGVLVANPADPRLAQFTSASVLFSTIIGMSTFKLVIISPTVDADYGGFDIISIDSVADVLTIRKVFLTGDVIGQMLRADIDGDFHITFTDGYLLSNYIDRFPLTTSPTTTFPAPSTNPFTKIGTHFNVIRFRLEQFIDRTDDYSSLTPDRSAAVHPTPDIFQADGYFAQHNFVNFPIKIAFQKELTWDDSLVVSNSRPKLVPSVFTTLNGFNAPDCAIPGITCSIFGNRPDFDSGRVDYFVPDNLIIGEAGEIHRPDGNFYKVDFEVGTIVLEIPDGLFGSERTINILDDFIAEYKPAQATTGVTRLGFPAMKFADCTFVQADALAKDQLRFSVSVQSFSPNTNGLSDDGYAGVIVDGKIGVSVDYATGLLTLNFTNLFQDAVLDTLSTKVQVHVFLKKGGFNNQPVFIDSTKVQNMLKLISVFSGANVGGPSALVNLEEDVTGVLPIVHGGTGLNATGVFGTVLTSNGGSLSYQFVYDLVGTIGFSLGAIDANRVPKTDGYGFIDPSFTYKNPVYIHGTAGTFSNDSSTPTTVGALTFRFDSFILEGLDSIKLEAILETTNVADAARVELYNVNTNTYLNLTSAPSIFLTTNSTVAVVVRSQDLKSQMRAVFTSIAVASDGAVLPQAVINVASTTGFPASGTFTVGSTTGPQTITYTGKTGTTFTGCTGGTGTLHTGYLVIDPTDYVYEIQLSLSPTSGTDAAICKMARLVMTYNNLTLNNSVAIAPPTSHSSNFVPFLPSPTPS
jgi:hypothetical protein